MDSIRQNKVSRIIQKDLGEIFQKDCGHYLKGGLITVTIVRVSPDLALARVYLSIFPVAKIADAYKRINDDKRAIRHKLSMRIAKQMRVVPELAFFIDDSCEYSENIDKLLSM
ncbi:MAG: ribosome-binding factor A [Bacteroidetes bacterium GWA2_31_9]|nr:MAG: ribosome-binding factor A [Bacteroidetes bacterium GWA2_31_9]